MNSHFAFSMNLTRIALLSFGLLAIVLGCGKSSENLAWTTDTSKDKRISARFPVRPRFVEAEDRTLTLATYQGTDYYISSSNMPPKLRPHVEKVLADCREQFGRYWTELIEETDISYERFDGIELMGSNITGREFVISRYYIDSKHWQLLEISVRGDRKSILDDSVTLEFLDSIEINF